MKRNLPIFTCSIVAALITSASATVTMDWVSIGDINNLADPLTGYGAVDHAYRIGKYEVTNAQYGEFLNAKGQSNANGIYNTYMPNSGITQSGISGSFSYTVTTALANHPVAMVSWYDAARFANWMMNGQGNGDMEDGAYTLNGATSGIITANIGAQVYIPSENEWYKAAYYNAANASYSLFPNGQNGITTVDANYALSSTTNVGNYINDPSQYGTFDQGGNVGEWNDAAIGSSRGLRGGGWIYYSGGLADILSSTFRDTSVSTNESRALGFRVAAVPEPTSLLLTMLAGGVMLIRRKR
jgi:sulfatase modifying factor 1